MRDSVIANCRRVRKKTSFLVMFFIELGLTIIGILAVKYVRMGVSLSEDYAMIAGAFATLGTIMIGLPIFLAVYSDDFKSHAMQTEIGFGLSRGKLVLTRSMTVFIVTTISYAILTILNVVMGIIVGADMSAIGDVCTDTCISVLLLFCYMAISLIFVYGMQSSVFAMVVFLLLVFDIPDSVLAGIGNAIPFIRDSHIHLNWIFPAPLIGELAYNPEFNYGYLIWILIPLVFIVIPIWLAVKLFRKKELEF